MSAIKIPITINPIKRRRLDQMLIVLRATMNGDEQALATFLLDTERNSRHRAKRELARELIDHCFGVH